MHSLRRRQVDVLTVVEIGSFAMSDEQLLIWAATQGRPIYTFNAGDFSILNRRFQNEGREHAGIIIGVQQRYSIGDQLRRIVRILTTLTKAEMKNRVEFLSNW